MRPETGRVALVDTGFWFALFEDRDDYHQDAQRWEEALLGFRTILLPWPILYETLNTRFMRRSAWIPRFNALLNRGNTRCLDDAKYRDQGLRDTLLMGGSRGRRLSLVDCVLQRIIEDRTVGVNCLFTYNVADFEVLCRRRRVALHRDWSVQE